METQLQLTNISYVNQTSENCQALKHLGAVSISGVVQSIFLYFTASINAKHVRVVMRILFSIKSMPQKDLPTCRQFVCTDMCKVLKTVDKKPAFAQDQ